MIKFLLNLFKEKELPRGKVFHMDNHRDWGDSIVWSNWPDMRVHGWLCYKPKAGDILVSKFTSGAIHEFQFTSVESCLDPSDMFFGKVKHLGEITNESNQA